MMTRSGKLSDEVEEYLSHREYGLALAALSHEFMNGDDDPVVSYTMQKAMLVPCLECIVETAMADVGVHEGRIVVGVSFGPGLSGIQYDFEEKLGEPQGEELDVYIAACERIVANLKQIQQEEEC